MIYRVLNTPSNVTVRNPECKTKHTGSTSELEERLLLKIRQFEDSKLPIITEAATLDTVKSQVLVFSHGWLYKFQKRHGLSSKCLHGEAAFVNLNAVDSGKIALKENTLGYEKRDVFNMDETAFFYCSMPGKSITQDRIAETPLNSLDCNTKAQRRMDDVKALSALAVATEQADACCWPPHPPSRRQNLIPPDGRVAIEREASDACTKYDCLPTDSRRGNNQLV
uniref:Uncharacterized protein AlNc14C612G12245 n=1 Tax=Albugo laibachii Nc14 TaxID=890382 RepID=F0X1G1_9STRA|nr:conserved hypothetical protein [Albugo laibachii Nc14]|eukprot:CCA27647.1 conserved hypothetical protein [Albugo laibachii Nc14]